MLVNLTIKNVALIDYAEINFTDNLNVLTGETGSGKSVIIDSLNFVLGAKADKSMIRFGENEAMVKAVFSITNTNPVHAILNDFDIDDELIVISRKFDLNGKSEIKVNGTLLSATVMKKTTSCLVDLHGQSEHYSLVKESAQLDLIDKLSPEILPIKAELNEIFGKYRKVLDEIDALGGDDSKREVRIDILQFQINEIKSAELKDGEEDELLKLREKIRNQEKIVDNLKNSYESISNEGCAFDTVCNAVSSLNKISALSEEYSSLHDRLESLRSELEDISATIEDMLDSMDFSEKDADAIEERLDLIKKLKKKYGANYNEIMLFYNDAVEELEKLQNFDKLAEQLLKEKAVLESKLLILYKDLHSKRNKIAKEFAENIMLELTELGMKNAKFEVNFKDFPSDDQIEYCSANGVDEIAFMFSANKGEPLKQLSKVISGGELSRFMLAIKAQTAKIQEIDTFVFDEIDVGISGDTAKIVAQKFAKISNSNQIIAISHLPHISAMADTSILIKKYEDENKTHTVVKSLDENGKIEEVARLTGGNSNSEFALSLAKEMIKESNEYKNTLKSRLS